MKIELNLGSNSRIIINESSYSIVMGGEIKLTPTIEALVAEIRQQYNANQESFKMLTESSGQILELEQRCNDLEAQLKANECFVRYDTLLNKYNESFVLWQKETQQGTPEFYSVATVDGFCLVCSTNSDLQKDLEAFKDYILSNSKRQLDAYEQARRY